MLHENIFIFFMSNTMSCHPSLNWRPGAFLSWHILYLVVLNESFQVPYLGSWDQISYRLRPCFHVYHSRVLHAILQTSLRTQIDDYRISRGVSSSRQLTTFTYQVRTRGGSCRAFHSSDVLVNHRFYLGWKPWRIAVTAAGNTARLFNLGDASLTSPFTKIQQGFSI